MNGTRHLNEVENKIKLYYSKVHFLLKILFVFIPLTVSALSFLYTLFGQSHEEFTLWENIYVSLLWGYGTSIVIFLFGIPFQLISTISNRNISVNNVRTADPKQIFETLAVLKLFVYCIYYTFLRIVFLFKK